MMAAVYQRLKAAQTPYTVKMMAIDGFSVKHSSRPYWPVGSEACKCDNAL